MLQPGDLILQRILPGRFGPWQGCAQKSHMLASLNSGIGASLLASCLHLPCACQFWFAVDPQEHRDMFAFGDRRHAAAMMGISWLRKQQSYRE